MWAVSTISLVRSIVNKAVYLDFHKNRKLNHELTKYHTTNKCTNCMSFILNHFFKTLFTAPTYFDSTSLIIIREHI